MDYNKSLRKLEKKKNNNNNNYKKKLLRVKKMRRATLRYHIYLLFVSSDNQQNAA